MFLACVCAALGYDGGMNGPSLDDNFIGPDPEPNMSPQMATVETRWWRLWITIPVMWKLKRAKWLAVRFFECRKNGHDFTNCDSGMWLNQKTQGRVVDQWCVRCQKLVEIPYSESKYANFPEFPEQSEDAPEHS